MNMFTKAPSPCATLSETLRDLIVESPNSLRESLESPNYLRESPSPEAIVPGSYTVVVDDVQVVPILPVPDVNNISIKIEEQPSSNNHRFRYQSEQPDKQKEGKAIGALFGKNSTTQNKTFPKIKVTGYEGPATIIASCVEEKQPFRAHPNNLIGKNCNKGLCIQKKLD